MFAALSVLIDFFSCFFFFFFFLFFISFHFISVSFLLCFWFSFSLLSKLCAWLYHINCALFMPRARCIQHAKHHSVCSACVWRNAFSFRILFFLSLFFHFDFHNFLCSIFWSNCRISRCARIVSQKSIL